jgi:hypothetical protein
MSVVEAAAPPTSEPRRSRLPLAAAFGVAGSLGAHGSIVLLAFLVLRAFPPGTAGGGGEGGKAGAGDTEVDVSLAGPTATETTPPAPVETTPPPVPTAPPAPTAPPPPPDPDPTEVMEPPPVPTTAETATTVPPPTPSVPPPTVAGGGAESTSGGRLPGAPALVPGGAGLGNTVEGQRALLPAAVTCKDPVVGTWEALKYAPGKGDWVRFSLAIHRVNGALSGTILSRTWSGGPLDRTPPPCTLGNFDLLVSMPASGRDDGHGRITFGSTRFVILQSKCYSPDSSYSPDNFSGTIDPARQEFQSVNNDGATDIDAPYVFRRIGCLDE